MNGLQPVVRYMVICEDVVIDAGNANRVSLQGILWNIHSPNNPPFPYVAPAICIFIVLTDCHGPGTLQLRIGDFATILYDSGPIALQLPTDPLQVTGWPIRITNLRFPQAGVYEVELLGNGTVLATQPLRVL
jgi:hypothetical protein